VRHEGPDRIPGTAGRTQTALKAEFEGVTPRILDQVNGFFKRFDGFQS
jgi:hypothetical protein